MTRLLTALTLLAITTGASANLRLEFREGAPKDRFVLSNVGTCNLEDVSVTIDLKNSQGKLIFDITGDGAGVEVFQPFEIESGSKLLAKLPTVVDGQTEVTLDLPLFKAGKRLVVSTDLDDTIGQREITVKASEFSGTVINVSVGGKLFSSQIEDKPETVVDLNGC